MKKLKPALVIIGVTMILLSSCYKEESVYYDQLDVTLTKYDTEFNFSSYSSFAMTDSTILKTNYLDDSDIEDFYAAGGTSEKTLETVQQKFIDLGYTVTPDMGAADFVVAPTILMVRQTTATYYPPGWWLGYPGYGWGGYPGWGYPGYPWNPGYVSYSSYKEGTIVLEMIDGDSYENLSMWFLNPTNESPELLIRWLATIDGYIASSADYNKERAERGINEAFEQSPYLKK